MSPQIHAKLPDRTPFELAPAGARLAGDRGGSGPPVLLLHGLTATRRYVTMGSRLLERRGFDVIAYDARGHGLSGPAQAPERYEYADLVADLAGVAADLGLRRPLLVGNSMGATTALAYALAAPDEISGLALITPAYTGEPYRDPSGLAFWDALADGLERDGVEGFMRAYEPTIEGRFADSIERLTRQRLGRHRDLAELARPVRTVPRSAAFDGLEPLERLEVPTLVIASRDEPDPGHPLAVAESYVERMPRARLLVEAPGRPPLAWHGAQVARAIAEFADAERLYP